MQREAILGESDPEIAAAMAGEARRQVEEIELIPSENYTYPEVLAALGSVLTNKYAEGYPGRRYYGGQEYIDQIETLARQRACMLFRAEHANVQPLSGSPMNQAVYFGVLKPGDAVLAMDLSHGGHLTHGAPVSHMSKVFNFFRYKTNSDGSGAIDADALLRLAKEVRPKLLLCGHSSYPRNYDYRMFKSIADEVGALTMADVSHIGGLIAGGVLDNPLDAGFDIVTTTTHKTLRGPRGGLILCRKRYAREIDSAVFPGLQGGPHMNNIAGAAITFRRAAEPAFKDYSNRILANARRLAESLSGAGIALVTGGTENHLLVIDVMTSFGIDGRTAQEALEHVGITSNKQVIPDDPLPPTRPSGLRVGTPAITTRGMDEDDMIELADLIVVVLRSGRGAPMSDIRTRVSNLSKRCPVPGYGWDRSPPEEDGVTEPPRFDVKFGGSARNVRLRRSASGY